MEVEFLVTKNQMGLMLRPDYVSMDNMTMKARRKKKERKNCR